MSQRGKSAAGLLSADGLVVTCRDGHAYDFGTFQRCGPLPALFAKAFHGMLSNNKNPESRRWTNRSNFYSLRAYLKWVESGQCDRGPELSYWSLEAYRKELLTAGAKLAGAASRCQVLWAACRRLHSLRAIEIFQLPPPIDYRKALAQGSGSGTLADLAGRSGGPAATRSLNEKLMRLLLAFCHEKAREYEARLELGEKWRSELKAGSYSPPMGWSPDVRTVGALSRDAMVETACKLALEMWDGVIPQTKRRWSGNVGRSATLFQWLVAGGGLTMLRRSGQPGLGIPELRSFLFPPSEYLTVVTVILVAAGVNPHSVRNVQPQSLVRSPSRRSETAYISFPKPRARGDVRVGPLLIGNANDDTVVQRWERLIVATSRLRELASGQDRKFLFLGIRIKGSSVRPLRPQRPGHAAQLMGWHFKPMLRRERRAEYRALRAIAYRITAKVIRATAKSIAHQRTGGNVKVTALVGGNKSERVLNSTYLVNPQAKALYEETMARGQLMLEAWLSAPIEVVENSDRAIAEKLGVDAKLARSIRSGERSLASGLCIFYERAIVIDTPWNCLRLIQFRRSLEEAEERMLNENPERWASVYRPQLRWMADAIADFPRKTQAAARKLDAEYKIPMPEVA